jgi:hypothetical protein
VGRRCVGGRGAGIVGDDGAAEVVPCFGLSVGRGFLEGGVARELGSVPSRGPASWSVSVL